ncbi:hypothetical protein C8A01DRAFT_40029, partial [Parachaetomium inaequale]
MASQTTLRELLNTLGSPECPCGVYFGAYLYLPTCDDRPGVYGPGPRAAKLDGGEVLDRYLARRAGVVLHGGLHEMYNFVFNQQYTARSAPAGSSPAPPEDDVEDLDNPLRSVAVVRVPWIWSLCEVDWGLHCLGCRDENVFSPKFRE